MELSEFSQMIRSSVPAGTILKNPGRGTSKILSISLNEVTYLRGKSTIRVKFEDLFDAYKQFEGDRVYTTDLKSFRPYVFDTDARPAGHDCNCTFLFMLLKEAGKISHIYGRGVRGSPFYIILPEQ